MRSWESVPPDMTVHARQAALTALSPHSDRPVGRRLAVFYDIATEYAGASFTGLDRGDPDRVTALDVYATTLLSVRVGPGALRRLTSDPYAAQATTLLRQLPVDLTLQDATERHLSVMADLYDLTRPTLSAPGARTKNQWVPASKLLARVRPHLFPVRDNLVCDLLGAPKRYAADWAIYRHLMRDEQIRHALEAVPRHVTAAAGTRHVVLEDEPLRLLDAALWTWAKPGIGR